MYARIWLCIYERSIRHCWGRTPCYLHMELSRGCLQCSFGTRSIHSRLIAVGLVPTNRTEIISWVRPIVDLIRWWTARFLQGIRCCTLVRSCYNHRTEDSWWWISFWNSIEHILTNNNDCEICESAKVYWCDSFNSLATSDLYRFHTEVAEVGGMTSACFILFQLVYSSI